MTTRELIRPSAPDDVEALRQLFREAFGNDRPAEVWRWKYFSSRKSVGYVCEVDGRLVAHCGGIPVSMRDDKESFSAFQSVDFMSSPSYAGGIGGGGVFVRTVRRMFDEHCGPDKVQMVYGFPGERHRLVGERLLGYRALEPVGDLTLQPRGNEETSEAVHDGDFPIFTRVAREGVSATRDASYLRWRYVDHPLFRYGTVRARSGWPIRREAAALLRDAGDEILLMELGGVTEGRAFDLLVDRIARIGKPVKTWMSPRHPVGDALTRGGFSAAPREHSLEFRFFVDRVPLVPGGFYYTLGDYDVH